jgi:hypothetical protein
MKDVIQAWWRALLNCLHPQVLAWSLLPLVAAGALVAGLGWAFWEPAVASVRAWLEQWALVTTLLQWLDAIGAPGLRTVLAPLIVVVIAVPLIVVASLLLVAWLMTPALAAFVARRRFPDLERRGAASAWWQGLAWSLGCTGVALLALVATLPLWLVPPLALLLPPLIWGWLAARVFAFDTLALHATVGERRLVMHTARWPLLAIGVATGLLGSAPSLLWAAGALSFVFAPLLAVVAVWVYTLMFAFAALWFAHFTLARLARLRASVARHAAAQAEAAALPAAGPPTAPPLTPNPEQRP